MFQNSLKKNHKVLNLLPKLWSKGRKKTQVAKPAQGRKCSSLIWNKIKNNEKAYNIDLLPDPCHYYRKPQLLRPKGRSGSQACTGKKGGGSQEKAGHKKSSSRKKILTKIIFHPLLY